MCVHIPSKKCELLQQCRLDCTLHGISVLFSSVSAEKQHSLKKPPIDITPNMPNSMVHTMHC